MRMRHPELRAAAIGLALALALPLAACSSKKKTASVTTSNGTAATVKSGGNVSASGSGGSAPLGGSQPPATITTPDGNKYSLKLSFTPASGSAKPPCAVAATNGRQTVGFALEVTNQSGKDAPSPPIGLLVDDSQKLGSELAAMSVDNSCIDFLLVGDTIKAGGSITYNGSVSNVTTSAKLVINMKAGTIGDGQTQQAFPIFK